MSYTDNLDHNRSSVLINAAQQILKPNSVNNDILVNSKISQNLLQEIDDDEKYQEIPNYQTQYIDQQGLTVNKINSKLQQTVIKEKQSEKNEQNQKDQQDLESSEIISKQDIKNIKKDLRQKQVQNDKDEKTYDNNEEPVYNEKFQKPSNKKYKNSFQPNNFQKSKKKTKQKDEGPSYITNVHGLKQEDFYKVDYLKKQSKIKNPYKKLNQKPIIKSDGLDQIEDIISQIQGLNKNSQQQIQNPVTKIMPKDDILGKSSLKYKKTKNMSSFTRQDDNKQRDKDLLSKLDDLLFNYRFNNKQPQKILIHQDKYQNENEQKDWKGLKQTSRTRQKREKKRLHESFKPIENQFYGVNQIKKQQQLKVKNEKAQIKIDEIKPKRIEKSQSINRLLSNIIILTIKWQNLPILPIQFNNVFLELDSYPMHEAFKQVINKINSKFQHYSIFNTNLHHIGLKCKLKNHQQHKEKSKQKQQNEYQLMNEEQFATQWQKEFKQKQLHKKLIEQQKQILMEFDIQWYQTIIKHCFGKQLQDLTQQQANNIDLTSYLQCLKKIQVSNGQHPKLKRLIIQNKLKFVDSYTKEKKEFISKCVIVVIPDIINSNKNSTDSQQVSFLKQQLKDNHRGGIYFFKNSQNLCILSKNNQKSFDVVQDCTQNQRSVKINDQIILTLKDNEQQNIQDFNIKQTQNIQNKTKQKVQIQIKLETESGANHLVMKSKNHTIFQIAEKQLKRSDKTLFGQIYGLDQLVKN